MPWSLWSPRSWATGSSNRPTLPSHLISHQQRSDDAAAGDRLYLRAGQEVQIEVSDIRKIDVLGDVEEAGYDCIAL